MKQPKDYEVYTIDEAIAESYKTSSLRMKILYQITEHLILVVLGAWAIGYIAGMYFGKFW